MKYIALPKTTNHYCLNFKVYPRPPCTTSFYIYFYQIICTLKVSFTFNIMIDKINFKEAGEKEKTLYGLIGESLCAVQILEDL
mgnify:FL=1